MSGEHRAALVDRCAQIVVGPAAAASLFAEARKETLRGQDRECTYS